MPGKKFHLLLILRNERNSTEYCVSTIHDRLSITFNCPSVLIAIGQTKKEDTFQYDFILGIQLMYIESCKSTFLAKRIKTVFEDMECDLIFKKGWGPICLFFAVQVQDFFVFGSYSKKEILAVAHATRRHKQPSFNCKRNLLLNMMNPSFGGKSSFAPKRRRWFLNWNSWNWLVKRAVFGALIFHLVKYLFETTIEPYIPEILLFLSDGLQLLRFFFWSIFKWLMGERAPEPQTLNKNDYFLAALFILYILIAKTN